MAKRRKLNRKPKRKLGQNKIYIPDWLKYKPYDRFTSYDDYYVKVANEIWQLLLKNNDWFEHLKFGKEDYKKLSLFLTNYFEDYVSDIGIWQAFTKRNKELYDVFVPFYNMNDYEEDYINYQDLAFLIWYFMNYHNDRLFAPDMFEIILLAELFFNFMEDKIDDAPESDFYETYFKIPDDANFFDVKSKLQWLALGAYIPGFEFSMDLQDNVQNFGKEYIEEEEDEEKAMMMYQYMPKMIYAMQDDFLYKKRSSLSAFSTLEWFADLVECSDAMRQQILDLEKRILGQFLFQRKDEKYYYLKNLHTDRIFKVNIESVSLSKEIQKENYLVTCTIHPWNDEWWVSGTAMGGQAISEQVITKAKKDLQSIPFYAYPEKVQNQLRKQTQEQYEAFIEIYGAPFKIYPDMRQAQASIQKVFDYLNKKRENPKDDSTKKKEHQEYRKESDATWEQHFKESGNPPAAAIAVPDIGNAFSPFVAWAINALHSPVPLSEEDSDDLFRGMAEDCHPHTVNFILENYPTDRIKFPLPTHIDVVKWMPFFSRYYNPSEHGNSIPTTRAFPGTYDVDES